MLNSSLRSLPSTLRFLVGHSFGLCLLLLAIGLGQAQAAPIAFVQANSATPQTPQLTVTLAYTAAQAVGDLNVVVVGWNDSTATVSLVKDTNGNIYNVAAPAVIQTGVATQAIYYAKNIASAAAGANTVTVTFSVAARFPDIRIAEYSGLDTVNPFDVSMGAQGNTSTSNSSPVTTTNSYDLLIGANLVQSTSQSAGTGYTSRRITLDGDILEDRVVAATGSYSATANLDKIQQWIMQMVAFRAASSSTPSPSITSLNPTSGSVGTLITISGANFGASQGSSTVTFNGIASTPTSWSASSIAAPVPNGATTGSVVVTVSGVASNGVNFTVTIPGPSISTLSMTQGPVGATVTITGVNFGGSQGTSKVTFGTTSAGAASNWTATSIDVQVPVGATTGNVIVTVVGVASNAVPFTVTPPPSITSLSPTSGPIGTVVTINGANFGPTVGTRTSLVLFNGLGARPNSWSDTVIVVPVPVGATTGNVVVSISGVLSNAVNFSVTLPPSITSLNPAFGAVGTSVTITGTNFGATQNTSTVTFNGRAAIPTFWSATSIAVPVPNGAATGNVVVAVGGVASNAVSFTVVAQLPIVFVQVNSATPQTPQTTVTINYTLAQTAGNLNVVAVGWNDATARVSSVVDTSGNVYALAAAPVVQSGTASQAIYYSKNIVASAAGANTVTVTFTAAAPYPDIRIAEYNGLDPANPLDVSVGAQGNSATSNSGTVTTANANDLLVGMNLVQTATIGPGAGYTSRLITGTDGDILEDRVVTATGSYSATAPVSPSGPWIMQIVAFRAAGSPPPPPISVSVSPATASVGSGSGTQPFTAILVNDVQNKGVSWLLSGAGCSSNSCGTLSQLTTTSVTYTGPVSIPNPATVTLTATSIADNTKTGTATITVILGPLSVSVSPKRGSITTSQRQQFTATVFNDPNNAGVTWQVDGNTGGNTTTGTLSPAGLFVPGTQAGSHTITATSVTNASVSTSVSFAVSDLQGVYMHHNDPARTGQNLNEYALTPATVNSSTFSKLFSCPVDGYVYAEPLYVANLLVGSTTRNVVFIATEHDSVFAFDADSPSCLQLWKTSFFGTGVTTMSWLDTGSSPTNDVFPEIGITSTPVINPATNTIYVEAKTKETVGSGCSTGSPCYVHRLHALSLTTGVEKFGGPIVISAPHFVSVRHFNRPALLLANNTIYIGFGSHGDISPWQGWLFGYDPATLAQKFVFSTSDPTSGSNGASIWDGGAGPAADANGNIYVTTGNGAYDGVTNFSESALKISPTGSLLDWFTPFNRATLDANDVDLGSAGIIILPDAVGSAAHPHLTLATGKIAILYLLDQTNMGKFNSLSNLDLQEVIPVPPPNTTQLDGGNYGLPAYWNGNIYTTGQNFPLSQFKISNGSVATPQFAVSSNMFPARGATPAVSASGTTSGIVWVLDLSGWGSGGDAILDAYDATNVANLLFSSPNSGSGAAGPAVKFTVPTVANGKVYVGGQSTFSVFGLLP